MRFGKVVLLAVFIPLTALAADTCTEESQYLVAKASDCLEEHNVGCAKLKLADVLSRDPQCAEALGCVLAHALESEAHAAV